MSEQSKRNGARSQGPVSPAGKSIVARNALRHGLTSKKVVLPGESPAAFRELLAAYHDHFQPQTALEAELVHTMAIARWRLRRLTTVETHMYSTHAHMYQKSIADHLPDYNDDERNAWVFRHLGNNSPALGLLVRYEATLSRSHDRALKQLQELRNKPGFSPAAHPQLPALPTDPVANDENAPSVPPQ